MEDDTILALLPLFTDLKALAEERARHGNVSLRAMMTQAWKAQSCLGDLRQAMDCAVVLRRHAKTATKKGSAETLVIEKALLTTAIMLYARATSTNGQGGERGSIQLAEKHLTPEQWADHNVILDVRNQAMAHVYSGRRFSEHDWHKEKFFAVSFGNNHWKPASATNQTSFHAATFDRLERMLPVAHAALKAKFLERMGAVAKAVNTELKQEVLRKHAFDPVATFGSVEAVREVLAGSENTEASFWISEGDKSLGIEVANTSISAAPAKIPN